MKIHVIGTNCLHQMAVDLIFTHKGLTPEVHYCSDNRPVPLDISGDLLIITYGEISEDEISKLAQNFKNVIIYSDNPPLTDIENVKIRAGLTGLMTDFKATDIKELIRLINVYTIFNIEESSFIASRTLNELYWSMYLSTYDRLSLIKVLKDHNYSTDSLITAHKDKIDELMVNIEIATLSLHVNKRIMRSGSISLVFSDDYAAPVAVNELLSGKRFAIILNKLGVRVVTTSKDLESLKKLKQDLLGYSHGNLSNFSYSFEGDLIKEANKVVNAIGKYF